jgi:hypothetical protein
VWKVAGRVVARPDPLPELAGDDDKEYHRGQRGQVFHVHLLPRVGGGSGESPIFQAVLPVRPVTKESLGQFSFFPRGLILVFRGGA